jgi:hypothetical protein
VIGYVAMEFEGTAIFLHEEDYARAIVRNGLWLDRDPNGAFPFPQPGYAVVEGRYDPDQHGHMALFSGTLTQIGRLEPWAGRPPSNQ